MQSSYAQSNAAHEWGNMVHCDFIFLRYTNTLTYLLTYLHQFYVEVYQLWYIKDGTHLISDFVINRYFYRATPR